MRTATHYTGSADRGPVAFLGLGRMGLPMSCNLARAGYVVRAWNRSPRELPTVKGVDYEVSSSAAMAGAGAEVIVTMLPDIAEVVAVCEGPQGALVDALPGAIVVIMGTVSPVAVRAWAAKIGRAGFHVVDAPVSGGDVGAHDGNLSIMAGGSIDSVDRIRGHLLAMGTVVRHLGDVGAGQLAKACNGIVVAATLTALAEAVTLGTRGGLAASELLDALAGGLANSRVLEVKRANLESHEFIPGGSATFQHKDLGFALEAARAAGIALPITALVDQLFGAMRWTGHGDDDNSGVIQIIEGLSGGHH
jgi:2-hydroxy-3-oxopropionate reductase